MRLHECFIKIIGVFKIDIFIEKYRDNKNCIFLITLSLSLLNLCFHVSLLIKIVKERGARKFFILSNHFIDLLIHYI